MAFGKHHTKPPNPMLITGFIALQMIGWLGCSILLLTIIFSRKIQRHATWTNLCLAWILSGVSFSLLFLGHQMKNTPYYPLCVTQAALIYASQTLTSGASVALAIQLLFRVNSLVYSSPEISPRFHRIRCIILVASPYLAFITFFIGVLVVGLNHPDTVQKSKNGMYCHIHDQFQVPAKLTTAFMVLTMFPTVSIEGKPNFTAFYTTVLDKNPKESSSLGCTAIGVHTNATTGIY
jgi:phosphoglycerol transferase MdoB-like AlkP superfamily enzyme